MFIIISTVVVRVHVPSYESTFVLSYFRTFEIKYFRTKVRTKVSYFRNILSSFIEYKPMNRVHIFFE